MLDNQAPIYLQMTVGGINHGPILATEVQASCLLRKDRPIKARLALTPDQIQTLGIGPDELVLAKGPASL